MTNANQTPETTIESVETIRQRASRSDREQVAEILRVGLSEEMISLAEFDQRTSAALGATFLDELAPLTADIARAVPTADTSRSRVDRAVAYVASLVIALVAWSSRHRRATVLIAFGVLLVAGVMGGVDHFVLGDGHEQLHDHLNQAHGD